MLGGVRHSIVFDSSDTEDIDDIPIFSSDPPASRAPPVGLIPFVTYRASWAPATIGSPIPQVNFIGADDVWLLTAGPREVNGILSYVITAPHRTDALGRLEVPGIPACTLVVPNGPAEMDVFALLWEDTGIRFAFLAPGGEAYVPASPDERLALAFRDGKPLPPNALIFASKPRRVDGRGRPVRHPDLPIVAKMSDRNFVLADVHETIVVRIYKMADRFFTVQAVPYFVPPIVFAFAIAVVVKQDEST
jgi:hypothetical protein